MDNSRNLLDSSLTNQRFSHKVSDCWNIKPTKIASSSHEQLNSLILLCNPTISSFTRYVLKG